MKKQLLHRILILSMALLVLFANTGIGLVEHYCQLRGKSVSTISASQEKKGCKFCKVSKHTVKVEEGQPILKKVNCCIDKQAYKNVPSSASLATKVSKVVKAYVDAIKYSFQTWQQQTVSWINQTTVSLPTALSSSYITYGKGLLYFIRVLRI